MSAGDLKLIFLMKTSAAVSVVASFTISTPFLFSTTLFNNNKLLNIYLTDELSSPSKVRIFIDKIWFIQVLKID